MLSTALQIGCNGGDASGGSTGGSGGSGSSPTPSETASAPGGSAPAPSYSAPVPTYSAPSPSGGAGGWPIPSDEPTSTGSGGFTWPSAPADDGSSGSTGGVTTWTWSSDGGWASSEGQTVPASDTSSSSQTQSWNDWFTALMNRYMASNSGSTDASMKTVSKIATDDNGREFGDGGNDDPRGFEHTQGWDDNGHWTD